MTRLLSILCILLFLVPGACTSRDQSELAKALKVAVKEKNLSRKKMENILREYEMLRENEHDKAREYATQIINAIKMGADSSHIEVLRRRLRGDLKKV